MADFTVITRRLATGAAISTPGDVGQLKAAGVTAVVDCRGEFDDGPLLAGSGLAYLWDGTADDGQPKPPPWFGAALAFGLPLIGQPRQMVYCHCAAGVNRGPSMALAFLLALGWDAAAGEALIRSVRPQVGLAYKADAVAAVSALGY